MTILKMFESCSLGVTGELPVINSSILALSLMLVITSYMGTAHATVIPISSLLEVESSALIEGEVTRTAKAMQGGSINSLSAEARATVTNAFTATTIASATWMNAGQGTVNFSEVSFILSDVNVAASVNNQGKFSYDFQADINGTMTIDYDVESLAAGVSAGFYLSTELFSLSLKDTDNGNLETRSLGQNSFGQFSAFVVAGVNYHLEINRSPLGVSTNRGNPTVLIDAIQSANFNWQIPSAVPVPAAVWLFGSGLIGLAGVTKRKK